MYIEKINALQLFADAGTSVNATGYMQNAYNASDKTARTTGFLMAPELKEFYDTELLENARIDMYYAQFGKKYSLPAGNGKSMEFRKWNTFDKASALQEGVIPTGQRFGVTNLHAEVAQYGTYTAITDQLELQSYDNIILGATEEMGASASWTQEALIRDALYAGTNVLYTKVGASANSDLTTTDVITAAWVNKAVTKLKKDKVPTINGDYVAVIHPSVAEDLRNDSAWINAHQYAHPDEIYNGEIGKLHGCRFIEDTFAPVLKGSDAISGGGAAYATYFFGKDAFAIVDPADGLEMIVHDKSEIGGPLNQFSTIGYKFSTNGATILYPERVLRVMSASSYSAIDQAN